MTSGSLLNRFNAFRRCSPPHLSFANSDCRACGESDSAFWAAPLSRTDSAQFCRWNLVSSFLHCGQGVASDAFSFSRLIFRRVGSRGFYREVSSPSARASECLRSHFEHKRISCPIRPRPERSLLHHLLNRSRRAAVEVRVTATHRRDLCCAHV